MTTALSTKGTRFIMVRLALGLILGLSHWVASNQVASAQTYPATSAATSPWSTYPSDPSGYRAASPYPTTSAAPYAPPVYSATSAASQAITPIPGTDVAGPAAPLGGYPTTMYPSGSTPFTDPSIRLAQTPPLEGDPLLDDTDGRAPDSLLPPGTRKGVFQKFKFTSTYMPQLENDSLGMTDLRSSVVLGLPLITRETPLVIEPEYRVRFLERPVTPDLPARLNDVAVQFRHFRRLNHQWIFDGAVTVGLYADDHSFDRGDAFRVSGRALGIYQATEEWNWIVGVVYVNRAGATIFPALGLAYRTDTVQYELVFPRPRAAWMLPGSIIDQDESWLYVMGEFGGGIWAIDRPATNTPDVLTTSDIRILFGYERKVPGSLSWKVEAGYVFARELEFASATPDVSLDDTVMVRAGFSY